MDSTMRSSGLHKISLQQKARRSGRTALYLASEDADKDVVTLLLTRDDVDVDSEDNYGYTPLSRAVKRGHKGIVELLLEKGAKE